MLFLSHHVNHFLPSLPNPTPKTHRRHHYHAHVHLRIINIIIPSGTGGGGGSRDRKLPFTPPNLSPPGQLFQPFRPPPSSSVPSKYRSLNTAEQLAVLRDRLGLWHEYAPLIPALSRDGFTPPSIEEATGLSGVEQNCLIVASQVRESLASSPSFSPDLLAFFDAGGGAELLYELRLLNGEQRAAAAEHVINCRLDPRDAHELARAIKDFPRRREDGWEAFSGASPGDCLAYTYFRFSREAIANGERIASLERALEAAETEAARARIIQEMEKGKKAGEEEADKEKAAVAAVPVVRLRYGEIAEATTVVLLPMVKETEGVSAMELAPRRSKVDSKLGLVETDKGWARWAVVPGWAPVVEAADEAVAIEVADGRTLPWRTAMEEERVLVIVDRRKKEVAEDGVYVVEKEGRLVVERGRRMLEKGVEGSAAVVVLCVRPPKEEEHQLIDDDWD